MNQSFITNITHFLDEKGAMPEDIPKPARVLAEHLGAIIAAATRRSTSTLRTDVRCWGKLHKKRCPGLIEAGIKASDFHILWLCPVCKNEGVITDWIGSVFDCFDDNDWQH